MREFDGDATEIVPHPAEDFFDFGVGLFRKRGAQLRAADALLLEPRPDPAHQTAGEIRHASAVGVLDGGEKSDRQCARCGVEQVLERAVAHQSMIRKRERRFSDKIILESDDDLAEHLPAFEPV